jgi:hypothetical protein
MYRLIILLVSLLFIWIQFTYADLDGDAWVADAARAQARIEALAIGDASDIDGSYKALEDKRLWASPTPLLKAASKATNAEGSEDITVFVTELIPWADCVCVSSDTSCSTLTTRKYQCTLQPWLSSFQSMLAGIIRYLIYIVLLLWVLALASLGVAWGWAGGDDVKMKTNLKKWWVNIFAWLIILFLFQYILRFIAPWVYQ